MDVEDVKLERGMKLEELAEKMEKIGFQATGIGKARKIMKKMLGDKECKRFLAFTANIAASGMRGIIAQMIKKKHFDVIITSGGAIDHDLIKAYASYEIEEKKESDAKLHREGTNRIGNILVSNEKYILLEKKFRPLLKKLYEEKKQWAITEIIDRIGAEINNENSFLHWAHKNKVQIYSPGFVDSALGLQIFFFKLEHKDFVLDVAGGVDKLYDITFEAKRTGALILGGGISKHFTIASNILRGGLDYAVYLTTAHAFDGSLSGAKPEEAISWGKIKENANSARVVADVTLSLPLVVAGII